MKPRAIILKSVPPDTYLETKEAAEFLVVNVQTIRNLTREGMLAVYKFGMTSIFLIKDLEEYKELEHMSGRVIIQRAKNHIEREIESLRDQLDNGHELQHIQLTVDALGEVLAILKTGGLDES